MSSLLVLLAGPAAVPRRWRRPGGGLPEDAAVRAALRRQPRVELIKELQVLERRVAALKSALREQPPAERPKSERW